MFYQPRHVVYHSHYSRIFNSHRPNNAERAHASVLSDLIRRGDQRATTHRVCGMLTSDDYMHVAGVRMFVNALVENLDQPRLLFKHAEQITHALDVVEVGLGQDVRRAIHVYFPAARFHTLETSFAEQHSVLK